MFIKALYYLNRFFSMIFILLCGISFSLAQEGRCQLTGAVVDQKDGRIAGAAISIRSKNNIIARHVITDETGNFGIADLPLGGYQIIIEATDFAYFKKEI